MGSDMMETDDFIIRIPKHIWKGITDWQASKEKKADFDIFERTGVSIALIERNSTYGKTQVQTLALEKEEYREKILDLLNTPPLYDKISKIFCYIYEMGCDADSEKRYFAARSVSMLSNHLPFTYLEEAILSKWAQGSPLRANQSAALALVQMIQNGQHPKDAINLVKHWSRKPHIRFVNTALMVYETTPIEPSKILVEAKNILLNEKIIFSSSSEVLEGSDVGESNAKLSWEKITLRIFWLIRELYLVHSMNVIEPLYEWFQDRTKPSLAMFAAITFLSITSIKDIANDESTRAKTVTYLYDLWEDQSAPEHQQLQQLTTDTIHTWAEIVLKMAMEDPDHASCRQFFHDLYKKCAAAKQNRLDFHLRRWQRQLQQRGQSTASPQQLNFLSLIPDSNQI